MIETRVGLQAALNGDRTKAEHTATPVSVEELAQDAAACVAAGARAIHLHPRDPEWRETLDAGFVDEVVTKVRGACGVPVGVTTSAEIEPDPERRLELVRAWHAPDYTSVNLSEPRAMEVMEALIGAGIGIEAGVWTVEDAERLAASGLGDRLTRILVEPGELQLRNSEDKASDAVGLVEDIHEALDRFGLTAPRLQHGDGQVTWVLLKDAIRRGLDTRIGLEDTLHGPNGDRTSGNEALVRAACELAVCWDRSSFAEQPVLDLAVAPGSLLVTGQSRRWYRVGNQELGPIPPLPPFFVHSLAPLLDGLANEVKVLPGDGASVLEERACASSEPKRGTGLGV